ncbi:MAG TPA: aminotransferase class III-fold pyridoxal phosphate-dependent enzyme, partial [Lachnospiraceae bacterium]|nr:aminotransferase class III-fold pyridoxal phosphate-dependent enzyme [Lachnospiraceae bacterium]
LLIFDEIQTGIGRTGTMFAYQGYGVEPDILTSAKALGGGIPLSAVIGKKKYMEQWVPGAHGGTFGGNPLACAAALETLQVIEEENLLDNCRQMGSYLKDRSRTLQSRYPDLIGDVRGVGLMVGIELITEGNLPNPQMASKIKEKALEKDLLILLCGSEHNIIRFIPPLNVSKEELDFAMEVIENVFEEIVE